MIPFSNSADDLLASVGLESAAPETLDRHPVFPCKVPPGYAGRISADPADPLLRQVLPDLREREIAADERADPVGDLAAQRAPRLLQKYHGRALLIATGVCPIHCRYCFRRQYPYPDRSVTADRFAAALDALAGDASIEEVILSGGDPLSLADRRLAELFEALAAIDHLRTLRIHTRFPVVVPERVNPPLLRLLEGWPRKLVIVLHSNHRRELDAAVGGALRRLGGSGALLLNQSVLLRGVNDDGDALAELSRVLFEHGVLPYYLHMLDPVQGTAHFRVGAARARALMDALRARLPGYLVPRLVREVPGAASKVPL